MKNKTIKDKKKILLENGYKLPKWMEQATAWGPSQIKKRTDEIAEEAFGSVWKV